MAPSPAVIESRARPRLSILNQLLLRNKNVSKWNVRYGTLFLTRSEYKAFPYPDSGSASLARALAIARLQTAPQPRLVSAALGGGARGARGARGGGGG